MFSYLDLNNDQFSLKKTMAQQRLAITVSAYVYLLSQARRCFPQAAVVSTMGDHTGEMRCLYLTDLINYESEQHRRNALLCHFTMKHLAMRQRF